ncbi:hypothetical protein BJ508DRAFT_336768 [Ascobolus immersus RN42]|uniref:Uncharacterized protein n=1 Tax=Ascobolus immersus RN42 TaxID=1160509 RepID=A0A3N4HMB1_ASCIM|nr:hypothetical protein BJ508DRAFT_336768 [Ascobolus immersus RN42]
MSDSSTSNTSPTQSAPSPPTTGTTQSSQSQQLVSTASNAVTVLPTQSPSTNNPAFAALPAELRLMIFEEITRRGHYRAWRSFRALCRDNFAVSNNPTNLVPFMRGAVSTEFVRDLGRYIEGPNRFWIRLCIDCQIPIPRYATYDYDPTADTRRPNNPMEEAAWVTNMERVFFRIVRRLAEGTTVPQYTLTAAQRQNLAPSRANIRNTTTLYEFSSALMTVGSQLQLLKEAWIFDHHHQHMDDSTHELGVALPQYRVPDIVLRVGQLKVTIERIAEALHHDIHSPVEPDQGANSDYKQFLIRHLKYIVGDLWNISRPRLRVLLANNRDKEYEAEREDLVVFLPAIRWLKSHADAFPPYTGF